MIKKDECRKAMLADEADSYYYANDIFHMALYRESGNNLLEQETKRLHQRLEPYHRIQLHVKGRMPQSRSEHEQIVDALTHGNEEGTSQLLRGHIAIQGETFRHLPATLKKAS